MATAATPPAYDYTPEENPADVFEDTEEFARPFTADEAPEGPTAPTTAPAPVPAVGPGHELPCAPAPAAEIKLFIARIPRGFGEADIKKMFDDFGLVKSVTIIRDKATGAHKNCAFVVMASISQADAAVRSMHNHRVVDSAFGPVQIRYATGEADRLGFTHMVGQPGVDEAKLFVGSLPKTISEDELKQMFSKYGTPLEVFLIKDPNTGTPKGCAFVKMEYKEQALYAIAELNGKTTLEGSSRPVDVRFAVNKAGAQHARDDFERYPQKRGRYYPPGSPPPNHGRRGRPGDAGGYDTYNNGNPRQAGPWKEYISPDGRFYYYNVELGTTQWQVPKEFLGLNARPRGPNHYAPHHAPNHGYAPGPGSDESSLFIFHIPHQWNNSDLFRTFSPFGRVLSARIVFDRGTNRSKGYAFVSYDNPESATQAVANMNGFTIMGKKLRVSYKTPSSNRPAPY